MVKRILSLIVCIMIPELIGLLSAFLTKEGMAVYQGLVQPDFAPPGWIFAPVWILLYLLMGIASWLIWKERRKKGKAVHFAIFIYGISLFFNFFWSILFFGLGLRGFAFIELLVLLAVIIWVTILFRKINYKTFYLMIPYILWVIFAGILNYSVWMLNRIS